MNAGVGDTLTSDRSPDIGAIRQQAFDIDHQAGDIEILIEAIFEQLDGVLDLTPAGKQAAKAINCFATCALTTEGGAS
jgi:hypothetical protein